MSSVLRFDEWQDSDGNAVASGVGGVFSSPGSILQVVRATDGTNRSTTSTTFVDITGMSVTITPKKADSKILLIFVYNGYCESGVLGRPRYYVKITDSADNPISPFGAGNATALLGGFGLPSDSSLYFNDVLVGYATPATTSAVTYKLKASLIEAESELRLENFTRSDAQMYAIEVSA